MRASRHHLLIAILGLALAVRLVHLWIIAPLPFFETHRTYVESDMYQFDQWARLIAGGDVLGRETYHPLTDWQLAVAPTDRWREWYGDAPTFFKAPAYAYLVALLYALFGDAMLPLAILQILASTASVWLIFRITQRLFGEGSALAAALLAALYAPDVHFDVVMLRGPWITLSSLAVTWQLVRFRDLRDRRSALLLGVYTGLVLLVNEALLPLPLLVGAMVVWPTRDFRTTAWLLGVFALGIGMMLAPVFIRNALVAAPPFQLATTGGMVVAGFNSAQSSPFHFRFDLASMGTLLEQGRGKLVGTILACWRSFDGPLEIVRFYVSKLLGLVAPFESPDNANFYYAAGRDPLLRFLPGHAVVAPLVLLGLGFAFRDPARVIPLLPVTIAQVTAILLAIPLSRFRAVLAMCLMPLAGHALASLAALLRERRAGALAAGAAGLVAMVVGLDAIEQRLVFAGRSPALFRHRHAESALSAMVYAERGDTTAAAAEIDDFVRLNPDPALRTSALVMAASFQLRGGNREAATEVLRRATAATGGDPTLLLSVGKAYADVAGDPEAALVVFRRALAAGPSEIVRQRLLERIRAAELPTKTRSPHGPEP